MTRRPRLAALLAAAAPAFAAPAVGQAASFTVIDEKADVEIGETTRLYIDERLVASFTLDAGTVRRQIAVTVPDRPGDASHSYALCGAIAYRTADGSRRVRQVSGRGMLPAPDGHSFMAVGAADFTLFYLTDPTDRAASRPEHGRSPLCQGPIS